MGSMLQINNLKLNLEGLPEQEMARLKAKAAKLLRLPIQQTESLAIVKKSVDARDKDRVCLVYSVRLQLTQATESKIMSHKLKDVVLIPMEGEGSLPDKPSKSLASQSGRENSGLRPVVVGSGPAGMFAALALAEAGWRPIVLERGRSVRQRVLDVEKFWEKGILDPESNVQFGEGGAGTFSDGKLTTGIKDSRCQRILQAFTDAGAPPEILYQSKPHIGTDQLRRAVTSLRERIEALGGEYRFGHKMTGILTDAGRLKGIQVEKAADVNKDGQAMKEVYDLPVRQLILAVGHSARDTFALLEGAGIPMEAKAFSIGVRIEHPQKLIDESQYGGFAGHPALGAADYKLSIHLPGGRSVYTFCMCPGGQVVAAASEAESVVTNGMSYYDRAGVNANSALLVGITPEDFPGTGPLAGVEFQRMYERKAFELAGQTYRAPAQKTGDFLAGRASKDLGPWRATYEPGVAPVDLRGCLPAFAVEALCEALPLLDRKLKGFAHPDGIMTGVETRSSSPVRILRDGTFQSALRGLYPCGEGAGYAGGIMSAAADGIRCAEALMACEDL
jgi:hypothetical protein